MIETELLSQEALKMSQCIIVHTRKLSRGRCHTAVTVGEERTGQMPRTAAQCSLQWLLHCRLVLNHHEISGVARSSQGTHSKFGIVSEMV